VEHQVERITLIIWAQECPEEHPVDPIKIPELVRCPVEWLTGLWRRAAESLSLGVYKD
jgi:hypothetical protein